MLVAIGLSVFLIFEARRRARGSIGTPQFVGFLIAVLAGIDAIALVNIGQPLALACAVCFSVTIVLQRRIAGS
jgi:drug/metabolite transporter (DMT)-like permease